HLAAIDPGTGKVLWKEAINSFRGMNILTPTLNGETVFTSAYGGKAHLFKVESATEGLGAKEVWQENGAEANMSSPVIHEGHAYLHLRNKRVVCVNLSTGKTTWTSPKSYGEYWSMVGNGDKILALDNRGILFLMEANPKEFKIIDERKISDQETWGHLAVVGNELFIREQKGLSAWEWK
ncbi:MAG: PQQ-binding-like beta-propeller repeat protein, partial [Gemmataceae bacterium]